MGQGVQLLVCKSQWYQGNRAEDRKELDLEEVDSTRKVTLLIKWPTSHKREFQAIFDSVPPVVDNTSIPRAQGSTLHCCCAVCLARRLALYSTLRWSSTLRCSPDQDGNPVGYNSTNPSSIYILPRPVAEASVARLQPRSSSLLPSVWLQ